MYFSVCTEDFTLIYDLGGIPLKGKYSKHRVLKIGRISFAEQVLFVASLVSHVGGDILLQGNKLLKEGKAEIISSRLPISNSLR